MNIKNTSQGIKSILKGHIPRIKINCVHALNSKLKSCDGFGNIKQFMELSLHNQILKIIILIITISNLQKNLLIK